MEEYKHKEFESGQKPFTSAAFLTALRKKDDDQNTKTEVKTDAKPGNNSGRKTEAKTASTSILDVKKPNTSPTPDIKEKVAKIQAVKKNVAEYTKDIAPLMQDWVRRLLYAYNLDEETKAGCAEEISATEERICENLYPVDDNGRIAMHYAEPARWAYANAVIAYAQDEKDILSAINGNKDHLGLPGLIKLGIMELIKDRDSCDRNRNAVIIDIYRRRYRINFPYEQATRLKERIIEALKRAGTADKIYQENAIEPLKKAATVSIHEIEQKEGLSFWPIPSGIRKDKDGKPHRLSGGYLLMESNRKILKILGVAGDFQRIMEEIREAGVYVPVKFIPIPTEEVRLADELPKEVKRHMVILHSALHRGWKMHQKEQEREAGIKKFHVDCDTERQTVAEERATVSMADWMINRVAGIAMLYWGRKPWVYKEDNYYEVYSLWERNATGQVKCLWHPERLKPLFQNVPTSFVDVGDRYEKLYTPYSHMMKNAFALAKAQEQEEKEHEATRKWAEAEKDKTATS